MWRKYKNMKYASRIIMLILLFSMTLIGCGNHKDALENKENLQSVEHDNEIVIETDDSATADSDEVDLEDLFGDDIISGDTQNSTVNNKKDSSEIEDTQNDYDQSNNKLNGGNKDADEEGGNGNDDIDDVNQSDDDHNDSGNGNSNETENLQDSLVPKGEDKDTGWSGFH